MKKRGHKMPFILLILLLILTLGGCGNILIPESGEETSSALVIRTPGDGASSALVIRTPGATLSPAGDLASDETEPDISPAVSPDDETPDDETPAAEIPGSSDDADTQELSDGPADASPADKDPEASSDLVGENDPLTPSPEAIDENEPPTPSPEAIDVFSAGTQFRNRQRFEEHYRKHVIDQAEFGDISEEEYMTLAQDLVDRPGDQVLSKKDSDGNTLFYDPDTNSFAVLSKDGYIRTFFKPAAGKKYYDRQT
ncbi:MAG: hypothetical protein K6F53_12820 [Lachnospiraceae bacterium]|nr:hypothetical protein [Lachnospiraceae bacterium]